MTTVRQLLDQKGKNIWSIHPDATVFDAVAKMAEKDVGSLVVMESDEIVGKNVSRNAGAGHHGKTRRHCTAGTIR